MHTLLQLIGESLLHFLWQGSLIALFLGLFLFCVPERLARIRHLAASLALVALLLAPLLTVVYLGNGSTFPEIGSQESDLVAMAIPDTKGAKASPIAASAVTPSSHIPWQYYLVYGWMLGVMLFCIRTGFGLWTIRRWRTRDLHPSPDWLLDLFTRECERFDLSGSIRMRVSSRVDVPMVVGWFRPLVLLPLQMVTGLNAQQWVAIIDHELAHVKRKDHLMNCLTAITETLLFYHPAVWWVSRQVRMECECCCDDLAAEATGSKIVYARALTGIAAFRSAQVKMALYANGGGLHLRIRRLLQLENSLNPAPIYLRILFLGSMILALSSFFPLLIQQQSSANQPVMQVQSMPGHSAKSIFFQEKEKTTIDFLHSNMLLIAPKEPVDDTPSLHPLQNGQHWVSGFGMKTHPILRSERQHRGTDFVCEMGDPIYATANGIVIFSEENTAYGVQVQVEHSETYTTRYAHLSEQYVKEGDVVEAGDLIAACGNSGLSVAPHLHYEVIENGKAVDPEPFLPVN